MLASAKSSVYGLYFRFRAGNLFYIGGSDLLPAPLDRETEERTVDARTIRAQNFVVSDIKKTTDGKSWRIYAEHISYQLGRTMLGDCKVVSVTPATRLQPKNV